MIDPATGIDFPFFQSDVADMFGEPTAPDFQNYLVEIDLTELAGALGHVRDYLGNPWPARIYGNFVMAGPLKKALQAVVGKGLANELHSYDGCFNIRRAKSGHIMSMHSWGLAVDLNAATNPFRQSGLVTDFSDEFVRCFLKAGFEWGGLWHSPVDAMHFQLPWIHDWRTVPGGPVPYQE
jgi:hypothetical protein